MNDTTRTHPRSMQEAFGPYTNNTLYVKEDRDFDLEDKIVMAACFFASVAMIAIYFIFN